MRSRFECFFRCTRARCEEVHGHVVRSDGRSTIAVHLRGWRRVSSDYDRAAVDPPSVRQAASQGTAVRSSAAANFALWLRLWCLHLCRAVPREHSAKELQRLVT